VFASTGQLNVLALAVFLGIALTQRLTTVGVVLMDEPIQNLDDLHFLAFLTLLKRVALDCQVVVSTADSNVAELFERQMHSASLSGEVSYVGYEWRDFDPVEGPFVVPTKRFRAIA
jgi:ABC-type enterochelin transport system ATPase subunit